MSEIAHDRLVDESYTGKIARLESELAVAQERISTLLTGIQIIEQNKIKAAHAYADSVIAERRRSDDAVETGRQLADYNMKLLTLLDNENKRADEAEKDANLLRKQNEQLAELNQGQFLQIEYLRPIFNAAKSLSDETEEYDFPDGLGQGAQQCYWDALNDALEPKTDAIADEMKNG